jgi:hypothetical protein
MDNKMTGGFACIQIWFWDRGAKPSFQKNNFSVRVVPFKYHADARSSRANDTDIAFNG